jgi:hypothetical protein
MFYELCWSHNVVCKCWQMSLLLVAERLSIIRDLMSRQRYSLLDDPVFFLMSGCTPISLLCFCVYYCCHKVLCHETSYLNWVQNKIWWILISRAILVFWCYSVSTAFGLHSYTVLFLFSCAVSYWICSFSLQLFNMKLAVDKATLYAVSYVMGNLCMGHSLFVAQ